MHEPIFILDSREKFQPLAVESVPASGAALIENDGTRRDSVDLAALPEDGGRIDFPPNPEAKEQELRPQFGGVGYRHRQKGGGLTWVQYWLWYLYNPKRFLITGEHEGDWEFVQVGYVGEVPVCMTLSQHHSGGARMWWNVQKRDGRPLVYVARDSHANFFRPMDQIPEFGDEADGKGVELTDLEWRDFDDAWSGWKGRWGNSTGQGRSPQSPACQGDRWSAPHRYHTTSRIQL
jgi:hypothetical protein